VIVGNPIGGIIEAVDGVPLRREERRSRRMSRDIHFKGQNTLLTSRTGAEHMELVASLVGDDNVGFVRRFVDGTSDVGPLLDEAWVSIIRDINLKRATTAATLDEQMLVGTGVCYGVRASTSPIIDKATKVIGADRFAVININHKDVLLARRSSVSGTDQVIVFVPEKFAMVSCVDVRNNLFARVLRDIR
jgi:hypothetical protein